MTVIVLYAQLGRPVDAIAEYSHHLAHSLSAQGCQADALATLGPGNGPSNIVLWQYNPFSVGHAGLAPWASTLPLRQRILSRSRVCVTFHELYYPFDRRSMKGWIWAPGQRLQCALVASTAHAVVCTTGARVRTLQRWFPSRAPRFRRIPAGCNLPVASLDASTRRAVRLRLGATQETLLLGTFGSSTGGLQVDAAIHAVAVLRRQGLRARLALLGRAATTARRVDELQRTARAAGIAEHVVIPGAAPARDVSDQLAALDCFLGLYDDGISGRRTSVAAALAHRLPVVASRGFNTDSDWYRHGETVQFTRAIAPDDIADAIAAAVDPHFRARLAEGAGALHEREFSWEAIARRYQHLLADLCSDSESPTLPISQITAR